MKLSSLAPFGKLGEIARAVSRRPNQAIDMTLLPILARREVQTRFV